MIMQVIMLIDMDYFFAACEEVRKPELKGKPIVVGADPKSGKGRGVVSTCNYEARKFGIHSAMPISMAYRLNKDAIYLPIDYEYYENRSKEVMSIVKAYADKFEQVSVDEAFIDVTSKVKDYNDAIFYAQKLKNEIRNKLSLPCSIGISYNKLMAKMACSASKPNGLKLIKEEDAKKFLESMKVDELYGIGGKTAEKLEKMGYKTIGELAKAKPKDLMDAFGVFGLELQRNANGIDEGKIIENWEAKSVGRESTFEEDTNSYDVITKHIEKLSKEVFSDVKKAGFSFKVITLKVRYSNFTEHLKSRSLPRSSDNESDIVRTALQLYSTYIDKSIMLRKIGIRVSGLTKYRGQKKIENFTK